MAIVGGAFAALAIALGGCASEPAPVPRAPSETDAHRMRVLRERYPWADIGDVREECARTRCMTDDDEDRAWQHSDDARRNSGGPRDNAALGALQVVGVVVGAFVK